MVPQPATAVPDARADRALPAGPAVPAVPDDDAFDHLDSLQRQLDALVAVRGGPPGAVVMLQSGQRSQVLRAGVADVTTGRQIEPSDHTRTASASKALSGAVALYLVQHHALGLNDTIRKRLPQLPRAWGRVTLRQLLQHTSGLPDYSTDPEFLRLIVADPRRHFDSRRLLDFVKDEALHFRPGSEYLYSNSDNIAVALMAEAVTGEPYETLLSKTVYQRQGLHHTSLPQGYEMPEPFMHGYAVSPPEPPEDVSELIGTSGVWASGGIISTPRDMNRFVRGYASGELTSRAVLREQRRWVDGASEPAGPGRNTAGLGIFRYATRCGTVLGHTGNTPGYTQLIAATPDGRRSLTVSLTSQINRDTPELLRKLREFEEEAVCTLLRTR
ncbi:serine hydrolase [Streptomyces sp. NBC_00620]|uniref:serine hydrolase domain-containing protein n=1 Tax=unclassified Streptomyces TaxID=2593676 RepID=UPI00225A6B0E|nr:serine hydrolase domain-containing protein [Streptomyces sp. NBC_00620]MCX4974036.1 beta-lactamase family protein [Streptomyces sp. NBC_00620]WUC51870.1 beta-lactamase family protein [Streptomyces sp. NBC_00554]